MNSWNPRVLRAVEAEVPGQPPGATVLEIADAFTDLSALTVGQVLAALVDQGRVTFARTGSRHRYWRIEPGNIDVKAKAA